MPNTNMEIVSEELRKLSVLIEDIKSNYIDESVLSEKILKRRLIERIYEILSLYNIKVDFSKLEIYLDEECSKVVRMTTNKYMISFIDKINNLIHDYSESTRALIENPEDQTEKQAMNQKNLSNIYDQIDEEKRKKVNFDEMTKDLFVLFVKSGLFDENNYELMEEIKGSIARTKESFEDVHYDLRNYLFVTLFNKIQEFSETIKVVINSEQNIQKETPFS